MDLKIAERAQTVLDVLETEQTRKNKELLAAAAICTGVGIAIGYVIGKITTSKNTIKKYNKCYSYDFGDQIKENEE